MTFSSLALITSGLILIVIGLTYMIISMIKGFTEVMKVERTKPQGENQESMWAIAIIISYFAIGLGLIIPLVHALMNKNYEGFKKLLIMILIPIVTIPMGMVLILTTVFAN